MYRYRGNNHLIDSQGRYKLPNENCPEEPSAPEDNEDNQDKETIEPISEGNDLPKKIGKYEILEKLGNGAMGVVYKGYDDDLGIYVAIKVLSPNNTDKTRFKREARALARLNDPRIVRVFNFDKQKLYIVMEFVDGNNLRSILKNGEVPETSKLQRRLKIYADVLKAMAYAHNHNVIHRDLKPENIMIASDDAVKVIDFGLARFENKNTNNSNNSSLGQSTEYDNGKWVTCGSPLYMSPEQIAGSPADNRSDIFSLGIILYELTTGSLPFTDHSGKTEKEHELRENISTKTPVPPSNLNPQITPALEDLIEQMLEKAREQRIQNLDEVLCKFNDACGFSSSTATAGTKTDLPHPQNPPTSPKSKAAAVSPVPIKRKKATIFALAAIFTIILSIGLHMPLSPGYEVGSCVSFGSYPPQETGYPPEPIEWLVLENDGKSVLLLTKYGIDCRQFHHEQTVVNWKDCDLRKYLNRDFLQKAFNNTEINRIKDSEINTYECRWHENGTIMITPGCGKTIDKVFCLSVEEATKDFKSDNERKCLPTAYAAQQNLLTSSGGSCYFWLRSPGHGALFTALVGINGRIIEEGRSVDITGVAIRPALRMLI